MALMKSKYYPFFGNLANPLKILIIEKLKEKPCSVSDLVDKIGQEKDL